jgi:hypothetical protein
MRSAVLSFAFVVAASAAPPSVPNWISGYWLSCKNGVQIAESWFGTGSGTLVGTNLTQGKQTSFEVLRVGANAQGGLSYYSMPDGAPVAAFAMTSNVYGRAVFENLDHDFPQRIIYRREGSTLHARIEGEIGGRLKGQDWTFRLATLDQNCPDRRQR